MRIRATKKFSILSLSLLTIAFQQTSFAKEPTEEEKTLGYYCEIAKYESEDSKNNTVLRSFYVLKNKPSDPVPAVAVETGENNSKTSWKVTRYDGLISAEVINSAGITLTISTTKDGSILAVKVPSVKNILNCNPPAAAAEAVTHIDHTKYGSTEQMTEIDPAKYGSSFFIGYDRIFPKLKKDFYLPRSKNLKEELHLRESIGERVDQILKNQEEADEEEQLSTDEEKDKYPKKYGKMNFDEYLKVKAQSIQLLRYTLNNPRSKLAMMTKNSVLNSSGFYHVQRYSELNQLIGYYGKKRFFDHLDHLQTAEPRFYEGLVSLLLEGKISNDTDTEFSEDSLKYYPMKKEMRE